MSANGKTHGLFINNEWVEAQKHFVSLNPATEEPIGEFAAATPDEVDQAVRAARTAFDDGGWSGASAFERGRVLRRAAELMRERAEDFAQAETLDTGKPIFESRNVDVPGAADELEYYGSLVVDLLAELEGRLAVLPDADRAPPRVQLHAFSDGVLDLVGAGRHLAAVLEGDHVDVRCALAQGR